MAKLCLRVPYGSLRVLTAHLTGCDSESLGFTEVLTGLRVFPPGLCLPASCPMVRSSSAELIEPKRGNARADLPDGEARRDQTKSNEVNRA